MSTLTIDIRHAEPQDAEAIASTHRAAWSHAYAGLLPYKALRHMLERRNIAWWQRAVHGATSILVLDVGGTVAGYATLGLNRARSLPQEGEIYELYLKPEFQGVGLGKRLFNEARQLLDSLGCKGVVVWCLEENHTAVEFYRFQGGRDVAEGHETFDGKTLKKLAFVWS
ncbi:ribosomal protein S18 acetylase RimI-like enzyme [Hoeflea halophila]|uniref:Ribosomal protein S18 acetylase RimI-like enzyme n=1 Tax=Hoeflea halophila TaxID=714899 RepID=A0A286I9Z5_9HYPH|nr:GNAT family N-acetyltransferase [Hoeflea halophila]SOE16882.1 ribosomal protein S18 acetylase RimI-like enzyme [Hoeflea halophila]